MLLAQAQYQEPFPFLGKLVRRTLPLIVPTLHMCSPLLSDASPSLEDHLSRVLRTALTTAKTSLFFRRHLACTATLFNVHFLCAGASFSALEAINYSLFSLFQRTSG